MDKATILDKDVDVTFGCPKCSTPFVYTNDIVPTVVPTYHVCQRCNIPLFIAPVSMQVQFKKPKRGKKNEVSDTERAAKKAVMSYGFSASETDKAMSSLDTAGLELTDLIKQILGSMNKKEVDK